MFEGGFLGSGGDLTMNNCHINSLGDMINTFTAQQGKIN